MNIHRLFQLFWIGACALAMLWQTRFLLHDAMPSPWLSGFVFGATVFGYNFATSHWRRRAAWFIGPLSAFCFLKLSLTQQVATVIPVVIWMLYYDIRHPERSGLRKYPVLKPVAIAVSWAWVTVFLPLPFTQWADVWALFVGRAAFIFALALAYDLCDEAYDRRQGFVTLVLQLGPRKAFRLIDTALLVAAACICLNMILHHYTLPAGAALIFSLAVSRWIVRTLAALTHWGDWRKVGIDGLMIMQLVLVWAAAHL